MKIRPLHDRMVVSRYDAEDVSDGGVILPGGNTETTARGKVLAVGDGRLLQNGEKRPLDIKVGDTVIFGKNAGTKIKLDGEESLVICEDNIIARIDD